MSETRTLDCGCIETLINRQGTVEMWGLTQECDPHSTQRAADSAARATEAQNEQLKTKLLEIDLKAIRALREGDSARIADYNNQAASLRGQLK